MTFVHVLHIQEALVICRTY